MQRLGKLPPLIARLEKLLTWLEMIPCPSFVDGVMLPKIVCAMLGLCGSSRSRIKHMSKWVSFSWKSDIIEFHMLTTEVSVIWLGVHNVHSTSNAGPCFIHVLGRTCEVEIIRQISGRICFQPSLPILLFKRFSQIPPLSGCPYKAKTNGAIGCQNSLDKCSGHLFRGKASHVGTPVKMA